MHCLACDRLLNDREATRKSSSTGMFIDLCNRCYNTVEDDIPVLETSQDFPDELVNDDYDGSLDSYDPPIDFVPYDDTEDYLSGGEYLDE